MKQRRARYWIPACVCFYVIAVANDRPAMYLLCWVTVSLVVLTAVLARLALHGLQVVRPTPPARVDAGQPLRLRLELSHPGWWPKTNLLIGDQFTNTTLNHHDERHVLVRWLSPRLAVRVEDEGHLAQRGRTVLGPVTVTAGDPLGLFEQRRVLPDTRAEVLVHPLVVPLHGHSLAGTAIGPAARRARAVDSLDIRQLRNYRPGDDLRHIDWKATARTRRMQTREWEQPLADDAVVLLDTAAAQVFGEGAGRSLETAITLAASVALRLRDLSYRVRVLAHDVEPLDLPVGSAEGQMQALLDRLALLEGAGRVSLPALLRSQRQRIGEAGLIVTITADTDLELAAELGELAATGRQVVLALLDGPAFADRGREAGATLRPVPIDTGSARLETLRSALRHADLNLRVVGPGDDVAQLLCETEVAA